MTLPISNVVTVNISIAPTVPPKQGFGTAALVTSEDDLLAAPQVERIKFYSDIQEVAASWDPATETYKCAQSYFGQNPAPTTFATISQGVGETEVQALDAAEGASQDWYGILLLLGVRDTAVTTEVAAWAEARTKIFSACTNDPNSLVVGNTTCPAYLLFTANYTRTVVTYSSVSAEYPDAAVLGKAFTTDFSAPNSVITLKFKPLAGITTENITTTEKTGLDEKRANALINVAGASMYAESFMSSQLFFDERHSLDWLVGEMESNVFGYLLSRPTKVPLTDKGGAALQQQVIRSLDAAVRNGMIGAGTTSEGIFLGNGYSTEVQKVADMNVADKANRVAPTISFVALLAGAVHFVQINGTVER